MGKITNFFAKISFLEKINQSAIDSIVEERVKSALKKSEKLRQEQDELKDKEFARKLAELQKTHEVSFENYKLETEKLIQSFKNQILIEKREVLKEQEIVRTIQKKTSMIENRFNHYILRFKEILFLNKKLIENIQMIVKTESQIEDLLYEIDHTGPEKYSQIPEVVIDSRLLDDLAKKQDEIENNMKRLHKREVKKAKPR
jgi:hypothetical protein